eukprot:676655-Prymnesium_polylepis.1
MSLPIPCEIEHCSPKTQDLARPRVLTYTNAVSRSTRDPGRERPSPRRMLSASHAVSRGTAKTQEQDPTQHSHRLAQVNLYSSQQ